VLVLGTVLPFVTGVAWLACQIGFARAIAGGLTPFLLGAAVKLALAFAVVRACESVVARDRR
jgi:biotin transport system substrate-specific component